MSEGRKSDITASEYSREEGTPGGGVRLLALCLYCGIAPIAWAQSRISSSAYWRVHVKQAMALWALMGLIFGMLLCGILTLSIIMIVHRTWFETRGAEVWVISIGRKCLLAWAVFWLYAVWRCLRGSSDFVPYLSLCSKHSVFQYVGMFCLSLFFCTAVSVSMLAWHAERLVSQETSRGRMFMLYDDLGMFPHSLFSLAAYRLSHESNERWGTDSAVLLPLTRENLNEALSKGTFVFVGSHGTAQGLLLRDGYYRPADVPENSGKDLAYVYLAGCDSGVQREAWEEALHPAKVKTYDRLTPTLEHLWWLWTEGPGIVRTLSEPV